MEVLFIHGPGGSMCLQTAMLASLLKDGCEQRACISPKFTPFFLCHIIIHLVTAQG